MSEYAEIVVGEHGTIYAEIAPAVAEGWREAAVPEVAERLTVEFDKVMATVRTAALGFLDGLKALEARTRPDEATLEFQLKLGGEMGVAVAKATTEGAFKVSLTWKRTP